MVRILMALALVTMVGCGRQAKPGAPQGQQQQQPQPVKVITDERLVGAWKRESLVEAKTKNPKVTDFGTAEVVSLDVTGKITQAVDCTANFHTGEMVVLKVGMKELVKIETAKAQTAGSVKMVSPGKIEVRGVTPASVVLHKSAGLGAAIIPNVLCKTTLENGVYEYSFAAGANTMSLTIPATGRSVILNRAK